MRYDLTYEQEMLDLLGRMAELLRYPESEFALQLAETTTLARQNAVAEQALGHFAEAMLSLNEEERQELFSRTFDVTPVCVPYVSIYLFGEESFKRGEFMAALNKRHETTGFHGHGELPDHIANLLRFAAVTDENERRELLQFCLLGPLDKMIVVLKNNPYRHLLEAIRAVLRELYPDVTPVPSPLEQMRQHGPSCSVVAAAGCGCGGMDAGGPEIVKGETV